MKLAGLRKEWGLIGLLVVVLIVGRERGVSASTYVVFIPLDDPIYMQLDTLDGLGLLYTYLPEQKPISRVEAARLTVEAEQNFEQGDRRDELAQSLIKALRGELALEVGWIEKNREDGPPTMVAPVDRVEAQYVYSSGSRRFWLTSNDAGIHAHEEAPLMPDADGMPISSGSNEIARASGWAGVGGFLTLYGEPAIAGPFSHQPPGTDRMRLLDGEAVVSLGDWAVSFGQEEMRWGPSHWSPLSMGDNAAPIVGLRAQSVHPKLLPGFLRYLGQCRKYLVFGQMQGQRTFLHPWIFGHVLSFKPLPNFEFGLTRAILFGGRGNDAYGPGGFLGRLTGVSTGNPNHANTHSRGAIYLRFRFPKWRGLIVYQEMMGEDNLTYEIPGIGRFMPFLSVSYQGGFDLPRLTADGRTGLRFEYTILEPNYSIHDDSLYWVGSSNYIVADPLGPNASQVDIALERWVTLKDWTQATVFWSDRAPTYASNQPWPAEFYGPSLTKEYSVGGTFDFAHFNQLANRLLPARVWIEGEASFEYVDHLNYAGPAGWGPRTFMSLKVGLRPAHAAFSMN